MDNYGTVCAMCRHIIGEHSNIFMYVSSGLFMCLGSVISVFAVRNAETWQLKRRQIVDITNSLLSSLVCSLFGSNKSGK